MSDTDARWTVAFTVDSDTGSSLVQVGTVAFSHGARGLAFDNPSGDDDAGYTRVRVQVRAATAAHAESDARFIMMKLQQAAGITVGPVPLVWVAEQNASDVNGHRFLDQARELLDDDRFELAVVAAQIHLEMQVQVTLRRAADKHGASWAKRLVKSLSGASIGKPQGMAAVELLLGIDPSSDPLRWGQVQAHIARRNAIIHEGQSIRESEARASLEAVDWLWLKLAEAART